MNVERLANELASHLLLTRPLVCVAATSTNSALGMSSEEGKAMHPLRSVELPASVAGRLYLHSMPGRYESLEDCWAALERAGCSIIVCLAPIEEIRKKSPAYAVALDQQSTPYEVRPFPIPDYQAPKDINALSKSVKATADALRQGAAVVVHCGAGIGRTGTFAIGTLMALGLSLTEARQQVLKAGSRPERPEQEEALRKLSETSNDSPPAKQPAG